MDTAEIYIKTRDEIAAIREKRISELADNNRRLRSALSDLLAWAEQTRLEYPQVQTSRAINRARILLEK